MEKDFEDWIRNDEQIQEYLSPGGDTMYLLQEGVYPVVQHQVRQFFSTKSNFARLEKSIFNPEFVNILLPNLHCKNNWFVLIKYKDIELWQHLFFYSCNHPNLEETLNI